MRYLGQVWPYLAGESIRIAAVAPPSPITLLLDHSRARGRDGERPWRRGSKTTVLQQREVRMASWRGGERAIVREGHDRNESDVEGFELALLRWMR